MSGSASISFQEHFDNALFTTDLKYIIPSLISGISTAIVLIASIAGKFWNRPLLKMIFAINTADFLFCIQKLSFLVYTPTSSIGCVVEQALNMFFLMSSAVWAVLFGHAFYSILKSQQTNVIPSLLRYYIPISLIMPAMIGCFTFVTKNTLRLDSGVCVYRVYLNQFDWFVLFHLQIPITLASSLCIFYYILSLKQLKKIEIVGNVGEALTLMIYPIILIICWGTPVVMQVLAECGVKIDASLAMSFRVFSHLMGFLDAAVYGEGMKGNLRRCLKVCRTGKTRSSTISTKSRLQLDGNLDMVASNTDDQKIKLLLTESYNTYNSMTP